MKAKIAAFRESALTTLKYVLKPSKVKAENARIIGSTMSSLNIRDMNSIFTCIVDTYNLNRPKPAKNTIAHFSIAYPATDEVTDAQMAEHAEAYLGAMGFDMSKTEYVAVAHDKQGKSSIADQANADTSTTKHFHIICNTVNLDRTKWMCVDSKGKMNTGTHNSAFRSMAVTAMLEAQFKLTPTLSFEEHKKNKKKGLKPAKVKPLNQAEAGILKRGRMPTILEIQTAIDQTIQTASGLADLVIQLQEQQNIELIAVKRRESPQASGYKFKNQDGITISLTKLGSDYSLTSLTRRIKEHQAAAAQALKDAQTAADLAAAEQLAAREKQAAMLRELTAKANAETARKQAILHLAIQQKAAKEEAARLAAEAMTTQQAQPPIPVPSASVEAVIMTPTPPPVSTQTAKTVKKPRFKM